MARRARAPGGPAVPFLKWAGGKTQLLAALEARFPRGPIRRYIEPFVGGGAVFFHARERLGPSVATLADTNEELINAYEVVRDTVDDLIELLDEHSRAHDRAHFYAVRRLCPVALSRVERAARLIYLNRTCFNGLYRVNSRGLFNVPMGRYANPRIVDPGNLRAVSKALACATVCASDFRKTPRIARKGDFVYFDPPYDPISVTSTFTSYTSGSFGPTDQEDLADVVMKLHEKGCFVMLSNSDTPFIRELYRRPGLRVDTVQARRNINSRTDRRGAVSEVIVLNYKPLAAAAARRAPTSEELCPAVDGP